MSQDQQEYRDKAAGKNRNGNNEHRKSSGSCMQVAAPAVATIGIITAMIFRVRARR